MKDSNVQTRPTTTPSVDRPQSETMAAGPTLTRRQLLSSTGKLAIVAMVPFGCVQVGNNPFSDGTFWDDGLGWAD